MPSSDGEALAHRLTGRIQTRICDRDTSVDLSILTNGTSFGDRAPTLSGRSVLIDTTTQIASAVAIVELDGAARRITIAPPDLKPADRQSVIEDAAIEAIVTDRTDAAAASMGLPIVPIGAPEPGARRPPPIDTEWVMLTSGTSGRPKMVVHRLAALAGAISGATPGASRPVWATFYDIRRYGGLQILLRAILGQTDLVVTSEGEAIGAHLHRLAAAGVTAISGTPSHWRRVLMSHDRNAIAPLYVRLSGEIADQFVLDGLHAAYPEAAIGHAYASTEAGVGFAVDDGLEGFPAALLETPPADLEMKVVDGSLRIRSGRGASRYIGRDVPTLRDADGFVDTGDLVERRNDRFYFVGRRGGIINVGGLKVNPEEVEAVLNANAAIRMSLVQARKNPLTGAIVVADVVLRDPAIGGEALRQEIIEMCRAKLDRHKVPALIRFVPHLALTPGGKLSRANG